MKTTLLIIAVIVFAVISSCQSEEFENAQKIGSNEILQFETEAEYLKTLYDLNKMSFEEKLKWEKSNGFISLGLQSDRFIKILNPANLKTSRKCLVSLKRTIHFLN